MSEFGNAPATGGADAIVSVPVSTPAQTDNTGISATEAARQLSDWRHKRDNPDETPAAAPAKAVEEPAQESAQVDDAPLEEAPVETTEATEPEAELPPIEPPRSWTKEAKERFDSLPRDTQEYLVQREQERDRAVRQSQNEAAEKLKGLTAKEQQVEQARQQYEAALPALLQTLQQQNAGEFSDIRTQEDVNKLASEDWPRFARWQAHTMQVAAVQNEMQSIQQRQTTEYRTKFSEFAAQEDQKLLDKAPELADKTRSQKIADSAVSVLKDIGFSDQDLASAWNGEASVSLRDHRIQLLILDAMKYREAKTGASKPVAKTLPPVQRPGVAKVAVTAAQADLEAAKKRFDRTGSLKDAQAYRLAQTRAQA